MTLQDRQSALMVLIRVVSADGTSRAPSHGGGKDLLKEWLGLLTERLPEVVPLPESPLNVANRPSGTTLIIPRRSRPRSRPRSMTRRSPPTDLGIRSPRVMMDQTMSRSRLRSRSPRTVIIQPRMSTPTPRVMMDEIMSRSRSRSRSPIMQPPRSTPYMGRINPRRTRAIIRTRSRSESPRTEYEALSELSDSELSIRRRPARRSSDSAPPYKEIALDRPSLLGLIQLIRTELV